MPTRSVTVGTAATRILAFNNRRTAASFLNNAAETIFVSEDEFDVTANGYPIAVGGALDLLRVFGSQPQIAWFAASAGGGDDLRVLEEFGELPELVEPGAQFPRLVQGG